VNKLNFESFGCFVLVWSLFQRNIVNNTFLLVFSHGKHTVVVFWGDSFVTFTLAGSCGF
jgi:hypothetical protein